MDRGTENSSILERELGYIISSKLATRDAENSLIEKYSNICVILGPVSHTYDPFKGPMIISRSGEQDFGIRTTSGRDHGRKRISCDALSSSNRFSASDADSETIWCNKPISEVVGHERPERDSCFRWLVGTCPSKRSPQGVSDSPRSAYVNPSPMSICSDGGSRYVAGSCGNSCVPRSHPSPLLPPPCSQFRSYWLPAL